MYGLTVDQGRSTEVFVTERERGLVRHLHIEPTAQGTLTYHLVRTFLFDTSFDLEDENGVPYSWTPCREAVQEEPQSEGLVFDTVNETLYVAFETIGLYKNSSHQVHGPTSSRSGGEQADRAGPVVRSGLPRHPGR